MFLSSGALIIAWVVACGKRGICDQLDVTDIAAPVSISIITDLLLIWISTWYGCDEQAPTWKITSSVGALELESVSIHRVWLVPLVWQTFARCPFFPHLWHLLSVNTQSAARWPCLSLTPITSSLSLRLFCLTWFLLFLIYFTNGAFYFTLHQLSMLVGNFHPLC